LDIINLSRFWRAYDDNKSAFAFTAELARKLNADILALTSLDFMLNLPDDEDKLENLIREKKDEIYCNLLEMKGYYHGLYNQWNAFNNMKIQVHTSLN